jgi:hypothetical protein
LARLHLMHHLLLAGCCLTRYACIAALVVKRRDGVWLQQVELKPWVEETFTIFAAAVGNSPLSRCVCARSFIRMVRRRV